MTETSPVASVARLTSAMDQLDEDSKASLRAAQGMAVMGVDLRIADQITGEELAMGRCEPG